MKTFGRDVAKYDGEQMSEWAIVGPREIDLRRTYVYTWTIILYGLYAYIMSPRAHQYTEICW